MENRGTANRPVLVREAGTFETVVLGRVIPGGGRVLFKTGWWWRYSLSEERSQTVRRRASVGYDSRSKNVLGLLMVWPAYVRIVLGKETWARRGGGSDERR